MRWFDSSQNWARRPVSLERSDLFFLTFHLFEKATKCLYRETPKGLTRFGRKVNKNGVETTLEISNLGIDYLLGENSSTQVTETTP